MAAVPVDVPPDELLAPPEPAGEDAAELDDPVEAGAELLAALDDLLLEQAASSTSERPAAATAKIRVVRWDRLAVS